MFELWTYTEPGSERAINGKISGWWLSGWERLRGEKMKTYGETIQDWHEQYNYNSLGVAAVEFRIYWQDFDPDWGWVYYEYR